MRHCLYYCPSLSPSRTCTRVKLRQYLPIIIWTLSIIPTYYVWHRTQLDGRGWFLTVYAVIQPDIRFILLRRIP
jgi:hypothetical protein